MGLLDDGQEYVRRSGRNLGGLLDWLAGGAQTGAEPTMGLLRGDALDQPLLPTSSSGGRIGSVASALVSGLGVGGAPRKAAKAALSTERAVTPDAAIPHGLALGDIYPDAIAAQKAWTAAGGKASGLRVAPVGDGTYTHIADPNFQPGPGPVAPAPQGYGGVAAGMGPPSVEPVPATGYMDRRGGLGRSPLGPRNPTGLVDPEGRPLYHGATIAGVRTPGGADTPLSIREEIDLNNKLTGGDMSFPRGMPGAKGAVTVKQAGSTADPPTSPLLKMEIDQNRDTQTYQNTTRHEGGHAIDYWTERTQRGTNSQSQHPIPDDVRRELTTNSQEMRPEHWDPHAPSKNNISEPYLHEYRNRPDELMADGYRAYKEDPAGFKAKYPEAAKYIRAMVNDDPLLSQYIQFNVKGGGLGGLLGSSLHSDDDNRKNR